MSKDAVKDEMRKSAPHPKCRCKACACCRQNADLSENYGRYVAGELVAREGKR